MALNPYFHNHSHTGQQNLIESLIIESIRIHGVEFYYLPRTLQGTDELLNEDDMPLFESAVPVEVYIKSSDNFEGDGDMFSKFGFTMRDQMNLSVARKTFHETVYDGRPKEGDMLYFPFNKKMFELLHTEKEEVFFQLGALQTYGLKTELIEYSGQRFETGITEIDTLYDGYDTTGLDDISEIDEWSDNDVIQDEAEEFTDFSESDPFSVGGNF